MTQPKMIAVWGGENILSLSIELFLSGKEDWNVIRIATKEDLDNLMQDEKAGLPDIVLILQGCSSDPLDLPLKFWQDHSTIKVIVMSLENNLMDIYSKQKFFIKEAADLIAVIESEQFLDERPAEPGS